MANPPNPAPKPRPLRTRTFAALDNRDFRRYYFGQGVSLIGTWLQLAAVKWIVFDKTHSEFVLGYVEAAGILPGLFVGLSAGALADRVAPRRVVLLMQFAQMSLAFALATLVGLGIVEIWQMVVILALGRISVTFEMPSRQVFLYGLVGRDNLMNAIALNAGLFNASRVLGPALAGVCLSFLGTTACFLMNALSYLAAIVSLLSIRSDARPSAPRQQGSGEILGGLAYLRRDPHIATLFLLMAFFGIVGMGYDAMIPSYARRVIHTDVRGYSILLACSGIGATCGALTVASLGGLTRRHVLVLGGLLLFAASLSGAAFLPPMLSGSFPIVAASVCLIGIGFGAVLFYSSTQSLIQAAVPDHLRGRIMGIWMIVYSGSVSLGAFGTGQVAQSHGVTAAIGISSLLCLLIILLGASSGHLDRHAESDHPHPNPRAATDSVTPKD